MAIATASYEEVQPRPEDVPTALDEFVAVVCARYGARLHSVVLFGSRARGDMRPDSDADVAVILNDANWRFWHEKMELAGLAYDTLINWGLVIQPWPIPLSAWEAPDTHHNPRFVSAIKQDARPLLEAA